MDPTNVPWRAYKKYRQDGLGDLLAAAKETLLVDVLFYELVYEHLLWDRLSLLTRADVRGRSDCPTYERYDGQLYDKGARGLDDPASNPKAQYRPGDRFICEFSDATLLGPVGLGVDTVGRIVVETVGSHRLQRRRIGVGLAKSMAENGIGRTLAALSGRVDPDRHFGTATVALPPWNNYYHWTMECLPRIRLLEMYAARNGTYPDLLVPTNRPSWMDETIDMVGYNGRIVPWNDGIVGVDRLVVPTFPDPTPAECRWLRDRMYDDDVASDTPSRLYISRADATVRQVENRDEIQPVLDEYGFETYVLGELSVAEQVTLFANADVVVSPHGAGLTNLVYADDIAVVELFGDKKLASFYRIAEMLDFEYARLDCEQRGADIVVDPDRLDAVIETVLDTAE